MSQMTNMGGALIRRASSMAIKSRFALPLLGMAALASLAPTSAKGVLTLTLTEIQAPAGDPNLNATATFTADPSNPDQVTDFAPFGDFGTNINIGFSNLTTGSTEAELQVHNLDIQTNSNVVGQVALSVKLSDGNFTFPGSSGSVLTLQSSLSALFDNSAPGDVALFQSTAFDNTQTVSTPLQTSTSPGGVGTVAGSPAPDQSVSYTRGSSYSLQDVTVMFFSQAGENENVGGTTTTLSTGSSVPEPTSLGALAIGSLLMMRRRRSAK
jgi:hypothetical protein